MNDNSANNMTVGNPYKHILVFAFPVFISQLFQQLYNTVDSIIVGQYLGTGALAAVSSSGSLIFLFTSFFDGMAMGAGVLLSREFGRGDEKSVHRGVHTAIALALCSGVLLTTAGYIFTPALLKIINTDPQVMPEAIAYFRMYFLGGLALTTYNMCRGIMMAVGDSKHPLYYLVISSCTNVVLDYFFVGILGLGVWSAALATVISQILSVVLCFVRLIKKGGIVAIRIREIRFYRSELIQMVQYGIPSGVQNSVIGLANIVVQSQINSFGVIAMATHGIYAKLEGFVFLPVMSFNMAITTFVSQNLGARQYDRTKIGARFGIWGAVVLAQLMGILLYVFNHQLFSLFTADADVIALGAVEILHKAFFYFLLSYSHAIASVCRGAGKAFVPMFVMLFVWCFIRVLFIAITMKFFRDIRFLYIVYPVTWFISSVIYCIYYYRSDWIHGFETE